MANVHMTANTGAMSHPAASTVSVTDRIGGIFGKIAHMRALYRAERELKGLDDRILKDIGIERADIHSKVWGGR